MSMSVLAKRSACGEIELSYSWTEKNSGLQDEHIERASLFAKDGNKIVLEEVSGVETVFNGCRYDINQYEISIEKIIQLIKQGCDSKTNRTDFNSRPNEQFPSRKCEDSK